MCSVELEHCDVWREKEVRARKDHKCASCRGPIASGERYISHASLYEGSWSSEKQCLPCFQMSEDFVADHRMKGIPSTMRELLENCVDYEGADEADQWVRELAAMDQRRSELVAP